MKIFNRLLNIALLVLPLLTIVSCTTQAPLEIPAIFSDNMVLQQNSQAVIWGKGQPNSEIVVTGDWGNRATTVVEADSSWQTTLSTIEAGGPYTLTVSGSDTVITINNVMLGEVWLASGQSNMEMPLAGWLPNNPVEHSAEVIAGASNPNIRMFTVARNVTSSPATDVTGSWVVSSPETAGSFSATALFFARKLQAELKIPVGIIHSSWGGTPMEAWISPDMLTIDKDFKDLTKKLKQIAPQEAAYKKWLSGMKSINLETTEENPQPYQGIDIFNQYFTNTETDITNWKSMQLPSSFEATEIGEFDGAVWFAKEIVIPQDWAGKELTLTLGAIDDIDVTYLNGKEIGAHEQEGFWQANRVYTIPAAEVTTGKVRLTVKVLDLQGGGGFMGTDKSMRLFRTDDPSVAISVAGEWKYKVGGQLIAHQLYLFDPEKDSFSKRPKVDLVISSQTPGVLYNAMISPLTPFSLKGTIWYQGEANVGRAGQYMRLTSMLITNWRNRFKNETMPFYYVQLAPWNYGDPSGISSAGLRDAQRRMLDIPNTGMAVTLDIGNVNDIHPAKKQEVGERLALWALANDYGIETPFSGPLLRGHEVIGNKVRLTFEHVYDGLVLKSKIPNQFGIAGKDGVFYPATAKIVNETIEVSTPKVKEPVNVRYAYKNGAEASLFNSAGLPAPSFSTEVEIKE
ncbi:sialate O-acetylesterase [Geofilum sp. OHC36d9]|uniref:sialate O-acetylesterase n=1 Tax=Geofilum sp. OHC36d9 TaxID=3458413 RepID=UPI0040339A4C